MKLFIHEHKQTSPSHSGQHIGEHIIKIFSFILIIYEFILKK